MLVIAIWVALIFLLLTIRFWNKHKRGIRLSRLEKLALTIGIVWGVLGILAIVADYIVPHITILSVIPASIGWASLVCLILFTSALGAHRLREKKSIFEAEILDKKQFELGETIFFKVRFKGKVKNGFFDTYIVRPDGKDTWSWSQETLPDDYRKTPGKLHGNVDVSHTWGWPIPLDYPKGEYTLFIRVYDHIEEGNRPIICEKKETVTIIQRFENTENKHENAEESKLIEVYSPIHVMIVRVNREIPREVALNGTLGAYVRASLIDFNNISTVFNQHAHELRDKDLEMWLEIEKEIKRIYGFYLGKERQEWFDELETEYNRLTKRYRG